MKLKNDFGVRALIGTIIVLAFVVMVGKVVWSLPPDKLGDMSLALAGGLVSLATAVSAFYFATRAK